MWYYLVMRILPLAAAFLLMALSGVLHGLWTGRWGPSPDLQAAASRCENMAMNLGGWEGQPAKIDPRQLEVAEVLGYVSREYVNRNTGQKIAVLLICGRPGPISVHTPDVCYAGAGYAVVGKQEPYRAGSDPNDVDEFMTARFAKPGVAPDPLRIFWSWSDGGAWSAPQDPRLAFARSGVLYKLYVIHTLATREEPLDKDPCLEFFRVLLPELRRCLTPAS